MTYRLLVCLLAWLLIIGLAACGTTNTVTPVLVPRTATIELPTPVPPPDPTVTATRVMTGPTQTPFPPTVVPTLTPLPNEATGLVVEVIDASTIAVVLEGDGFNQAYVVKYIGVEAPSLLEPWYRAATAANRRITQFQVVQLLRDQTDFDADGNLLRHVFLDGELLSEALAAGGYVRANTEEPNTAYADDIAAAEALAQEQEVGVWGPPPTATPIPVSPTATEVRLLSDLTPAADSTPDETPGPTPTEEE